MVMTLKVPGLWKESPVEGVPVIPYGNFLTGHWHLLLEQDFQKSLDKFSVEHADEQGRCTFWMGATTPNLSVTRCEDVQVLLKFSSHREIFPVTAIHMEKFLGRYEIGSLTGTEWKSKRSVIVKALHGRKVLENYKQAFVQAANTMVKSLGVIQFVEDITLLMKMVTMDAFGLASLSADFGCCRKLRPSRVMKDFEYISAEVMKRMTTIHALNPASHVYQLPTTANKKLNFTMNRMDDFVLEIIDKRKTQVADAEDDQGIPQDLLTSLIEETVENSDGMEQDVMDRMLADTIKSLLFAGYETTSVTLTYVLYLLSKNPDVERRCVEEIRAKPDEHVYLDAVIKETLRLFPPVPSTTRMLERDVRFGGLHVPAGTHLFVPIWIIQRDERHFKWALKFIPERWARFDEDKGAWVPRGADETNDFEGVPTGNPKAFLTFSSGPRSCPGQRFALQKMNIILSTLLRNFTFQVPKGYRLMIQRPGFVQCPKGGIPMNIEKRRNKKSHSVD
jgi:cytochrome P450